MPPLDDVRCPIPQPPTGARPASLSLAALVWKDEQARCLITRLYCTIARRAHPPHHSLGGLSGPPADLGRTIRRACCRTNPLGIGQTGRLYVVRAFRTVGLSGSSGLKVQAAIVC